MTDYTRKIENVPEDEARNWPKGCIESSHEFMDLEISPIVSRKYYNNEELFYFYMVRVDELINEELIKGGKISMKEIEAQARVDLLPVIYPDPVIDIVNFREKNPDISDKCCRLIFHMPLWKIANFHIVHGEALKFINNAREGDVELNIPDDPLWGWDMTNPADGFPCINLNENGCIYHPDDKPYRCKVYPERQNELIETCSYTFDENGKVSGTCDRCIKQKSSSSSSSSKTITEVIR